MRWSGRQCSTLGCLILVLGCLWGVVGALGDPYRVLGVDRSANLQDIRKAYKQLAKEWHPDKTSDPQAETKFVEIKQAYELLSDPERRRAFDLHGITEDTSTTQPRHDYSQYERFTADPFDEFFGGNRFQFKEQDITFFHKLSITTRHFDMTLTPKSKRTPHLLLFYTDWCFPCMQAAPIWRRMVDQLEPLGLAVATVHAGHEGALARRVSVHSLPCLVLLIDGTTYVYKDSVYSVQRVVDFIKSKLPYKLVPKLRDESIDSFLSGWGDNRVRGLVFEPKTIIRLRYLLLAYHYRDRVAFGFVQVGAEDSKEIVKKYNVASNLDTLILLDEDPNKPRASVAMRDIPAATLHNVISTNQYLALPRLSSQSMLDAVCPPEWSRPRKRLCAVLVTEATDQHDAARNALRAYARHAPWGSDRIRFTYLYLEKQAEFVQTLKEGEGSPDEPLLRIVIIWRRDTSHIKYEWVAGQWVDTESNGEISQAATGEGGFNDTRQRLDDTIQRLLKSSEALTYEAVVNDLLDEHAQGMISKIVMRILITMETMMDGLGREHILPVVSVLGTILCVIGIGYVLTNMVRQEEESIKAQMFCGKQNGNNNNDGSPRSRTQPKSVVQPELRLHELRAEKYNGLVRLLKPGCRTIVLLVDTQSRLQLLPEFHRIVWAYRKNKTLMFAHMALERGLGWYQELLQLSLPEPRTLNINPRNCVGTVLALNGHRKYFCMFHAKHPESAKGSKRMDKMTRKITKPGDPEVGAFIGFETDTTDSSDEDTGILLQGTLLEGLPNWLDRLFEGSTHRYYINYWPDFTAK